MVTVNDEDLARKKLIEFMNKTKSFDNLKHYEKQGVKK